MAPIISPKLLSQIMMYGCAVEITKASYVKALCADLMAHPVAVYKPTILISGSVPPLQKKSIASCSNKVSCTSLPNSTFINNLEGTHSEASLTSEDSLISAAEIASLSAVHSDEELEQPEQVTSKSGDPLEVTCASNVPSTVPSTVSEASFCEPPSTAATSIPTCEASKQLEDPLQRFGTPPVADCAYTSSPDGSLNTAPQRRASEATGAKPSSTFIPRSRKFSYVRGLKGLGLRSLWLFKKVKW